jgi:hypothetical protein
VGGTAKKGRAHSLIIRVQLCVRELTLSLHVFVTNLVIYSGPERKPPVKETGN